MDVDLDGVGKIIVDNMGDSWYVYSTRGHICCYQHINTSCMRGACDDHVVVMWWSCEGHVRSCEDHVMAMWGHVSISELWWTAEGQLLFACSMHTPVFYYSKHTVSNQKAEMGNAGNETMTVMWWSCDVMWWSCDGHVMVMWWIVCVIFSTLKA